MSTLEPPSDCRVQPSNSFVLTVDTADSRRRRNAAQQLNQLGFSWEFIRGFRAESHSVQTVYWPLANWAFMKRSMAATEVAVYLGHRKIWQTIVERRLSQALVLEDDFQVTDAEAFQQGISDALAQQHRWDIVKFFDFKPKRTVDLTRWNQTDFVRHKYPSSGCVAYLIRAEAAQRLLERKRIYRPVDDDLSHPWEKSLRILSMVPNPVQEVAEVLGGSLLEADRNRVRQIQRSQLRAIYANLLAAHKQFRACLWNRS